MKDFLSTCGYIWIPCVCYLCYIWAGFTTATSNKWWAVCDFILLVHSHQSKMLANEIAEYCMFYNLHELNILFFINSDNYCLLWCTALWCIEPLQTNPVHSNRWYVLLGNKANCCFWLCTVCHWVIILKEILLSFLCELFTLKCMLSL
jgi:hypothetical protein